MRGGSVARCARCHMTPPSPSFCPLLWYCVIASQQLAQIWGLEVMNGAGIDPCFYCGAGFTSVFPEIFSLLLAFFPLGGCAWAHPTKFLVMLAPGSSCLVSGHFVPV